MAALQRKHIRLGNIRLALAIVAGLMAWRAFWHHEFSGWWLAVPVALFIGIAAYHARVLRAQSYAERAAAVYRNGLARMEDRWAGTGRTGDRFRDPAHIYADDLDLFGRGSLFELLSVARTRIGEETLASWLLAPATANQILERQAAIAELRGQLDLREDIAVLGEDAGVGVHPEAFARWAEAPNRLTALWIRYLAVALAAAAVAGFVIWGVWGSLWPLVVVLLAEGILSYRLGKRVEQILHGTEHAFHNLDLLSGILARLEQQEFQSPRMKGLQRDLQSHQTAGSAAIARLRTLVDFINSRDNLFVRIVDVPLMYSVQMAFAAEHWRSLHGSAARQWLRVVGEVEALLSLSAYNYEHPEDPFPEIVYGPGQFHGEQVGHPLIAAAKCVRNDVRLEGDSRVLLVSGSNMSGKSTLLRATGINTVLAMAGAPVRARKLRLTPMHVGASIRVNDSLQEGSSRFYAEITRLRRVFDAAGQGTLLFLLDELLQGTNSNDRRIGAEGIVRALLEHGAIGLVSTHDLALTDLGALDRYLHNVHFQDELENGQMRFDYRLREGVVTKSNGLELMRSIGLKV